jgi:MFS family permease
MPQAGSLIASLALSREQKVLVPDEATEETKKSGFASIVPDMQQGVGFILGHAALLFVMLAFAAGMFVLGCFGPLIAVYVRDSLHASTRTFGVVSAMIGAGLIIGAQLVNSVGKKLRNSTLVLMGLGGIAVGLSLLTFVTFVWATILANLFIGIAVAAIVVPATTMMQQETPEELMGRVGSAVMSLIFTAQILGLALSGTLADHVGVRHVFAYCGVALVLLIVIGKLFMEPKHDASAPAAA